MALADLNVTIGLQIKNFQKSLGQLEKDLNRFQRTFSNIGQNLTQSISLPLAGIGTAAVAAFGEFESLERAFAAVAAEGTSVAAEIERLRKVAQAPGLGFNEAVQASTRLQAVGLSAGEAARVIEQYGNAVARSGGGRAEFEGSILALTQIASKGKISAEEINQLNERIFEIRPALQAAFGTSDSEALQKQGISAEEFLAKTTEQLSKLQRVQGGLANAFENLQDSVRGSLTELGRTIATTLNVDQVFQNLANRLQEAINWFKNLTPEAQALIVKLGAIAVAIGPVLIGIAKIASLGTVLTTTLSGIGAQAGKLAVLLGPTGLGVAAVLFIAGGAVKALYDRYRELNPVVNTFNNYISQETKELVGQKTQFNALINTLADANISTSTRTKIIGELNSQYSDYLPSLITEKTSIDEIRKAQAQANIEFEKRIRLTAIQGVSEKQQAKLVELAQKEFELQVKITKAREEASAQFEKLNSNFVAGGQAAEAYNNSAVSSVSNLNRLESQLSAVQFQFKALSDENRKVQKTLDSYIETVIKATDETQKLSNVPTPSIIAPATSKTGAGAKSVTAPPKPRETFDIAPLQSYALALQMVTSQTDVFSEAAIRAKANTDSFVASLANFTRPSELVIALGDAVLAAGNAFADLAAQGETSLRKLGQAALQAARQTISAFIREGVAGIVRNILAGPTGKALGPAALAVAAAAGGGAALLFNSLLNKITAPKLAKGGLAFAPTLAVVGDNPAARTDPEVIAPLSRLRDMLGGSIGGGFVAEARISGSDLALLVSRANLRNERIR